MKIIIAGPRDFYDSEFIYQKLDDFFSKTDGNIHIIEGGASGVDSIARKYAQQNNISFSEYPANWNKYGRRAGPIRNQEMASVSDELVAFVYKQNPSKGTQNMINTAKKKGLKVKIYYIPL